ncbi:exosporium leader peptide-containing protein, partial [Bacillus sp. SH7-1]|uniref:exosporium leader peptide-containing protein n=1 Tax=Bacillus sp. SH7-1 TaxID=2217818 RepID=UPI00351ADF60
MKKYNHLSISFFSLLHLILVYELFRGDNTMDEFLSSAAFNPDLIGPTLPPIQPFQLPTGPTGP